MPTISKDHLSSSTDGAPIALPINTGTFQTLHTGPTNANSMDELWVWGCNATGVSEETVTLRLGGTGNSNKIKATIGPNQTVLLVPGIPIQGNGTPLVLDGASTTADKVNIFGYVNKIVG